MGIEKIGLPARPAAKGRTWVLDASSCQTCQIPFSLFNRKHHCRRCGGLFCGNCSNSRVILRGQGDGPVRVCEPCKKLEEAARFQARNRGKASKGVLLISSRADDESLLKEVLGDGIQSVLSGGSELLDHDNDGHHGSVEISPSEDKTIELQEENSSPEKLREQALEQKKIYTVLKREGKNAEALLAFKRHKELGREADALELSLKKLAISQRKALAEGLPAGNQVQKAGKDLPESAKEKGHQGTLEEASHGLASGRKSQKEGGDDDLLKSLKDLGWNEADLNEKKVKKGPTSDLELLAEIRDSAPQEASSKKSAKENPTQLEILAHKRQALALKREGKPAEAKEELKKAKLLEKKLEEMALFGDDEEEDDDELAALMRNLDKEAKTGKGKDLNIPLSEGDIPLSFSLDDDDDETNVDVTDDDINDPSMQAALRAMGWVEEAAAMERSRAPETAGPEVFHIAASVTEQSSLQSEILTHKRRALTLKREGKLAEAKVELQEARLLEQKLEVLKSQPIPSNALTTGKLRGGPKDTGVMRLEQVLEDNDDGVEVDEEDMRDPEMMAALKAMGFEEEETETPLQTLVKPSSQEKKNLQDEILSIKRSALALKKQGRITEAREELRQSKLLEQRLLKMQGDLEANGLPPVATMGKRQQTDAQIPISALPLAGFVSEDEEEEVEVSAEDFMDPDLVAALKSVGWQEEDTFVKDEDPEKEPATLPDSPPTPIQPYKAVELPPKERARKLQLQKELLSHKRKALTLKREGKVEEAKLELKQAKILEKEMEEIENVALALNEDLHKKSIPQSKQSIPDLPMNIGDEYDDEDEDVTDADMQDPELLDALKAFGWKPEPEKSTTVNKTSSLSEPTRVDKLVSVGKLHDAKHKVEMSIPPYTKSATDPLSDPIWYAITNSASKKHTQVQNSSNDEKHGGEAGGAKNLFEGESGKRTSPPNATLFDYPSSVTGQTQKASGQAGTFDLLSGGQWESSVENIPEKDESEEEDDVFDSGLMAALQSIGMGPPSKGSSVKQLDTENLEVRRNTNMKEKTVIPQSRQSAETNLLPIRKTDTESAGSSTSDQEGNAEKVGPAKPVRSTSLDATDNYRQAAAPRVESHVPVAVTKNAAPDILEEIKIIKRKALALKREGKLSEAREELRLAKVLEKQLETATEVLSEVHQSPDNMPKTIGGHSLAATEKPSEAVSPVKSHTSPTSTQSHKEQLRQEVRQGKDRMKLQQESLAHKRKALNLRREGKVDEAEAEFELAKSLEKQMEDLDAARSGQSKGPALEIGDMGMVEDLLDPQLMAALKGLGWNDGDLHGGANTTRVSGSAPVPNKTNHQPTSVGGPVSVSVTDGHEKHANSSSQNAQSTGGRSTVGLIGSDNKVQQERIGNKTSQQSQPTAGRSTSIGIVTGLSKKADDEISVNRNSQQVVPSRVGGRNTSGGGGSTASTNAQAERKQLEDRIKQEKVKAVELKRAGRQGEALEVLRGAKRLEKQLLSMAA